MGKRILVALWKTRSDQKHLARPTGERVALLGQALAGADREAAHRAIPKGQNLRAILVAPEYFFAAQEAGEWNAEKKDFTARSLSREERDDLVRDLEGLSREHPTILFIPGTIAWQESLDAPSSRRGRGQTQGTRAVRDLERHINVRKRVLGTASAVRDDEEFQPAKISPALRRVAKRKGYVGDDAVTPALVAPLRGPKNLPDESMHVSPSSQDKLSKLRKGEYSSLMRNTAYVLFNGRVQFCYHKHADFHEALGDSGTVFVPGGQVGTVEIAGIRLGIEICFDHTMRVLGTGVDSHTRRGEQMTPPLIHIVTSDSTDNVPDNYQARDQGYFIHASTSESSNTVAQRQGNSYVDIEPDREVLPPRHPGDILTQYAPDQRVGRYPLGCWIITV